MAAVSLAWWIASTGPALAESSSLIVPGVSLEAERSGDGTTALEVPVINLSSDTDPLTVLLDPDASCDAPSQGEDVPPLSQVTLTFTMQCRAGAQPRSATVGGVEIAFTVKEKPAPNFAQLRWFFAGALLAAVGVLAGYRAWQKNPLGNPTPDNDSLKAALVDKWRPSKRRSRSAGRTMSPFQPPRAARTHRPPRTGLLAILPGLSSDWKFSDNWASNVGFGAALFTGIFTATGPITEILGKEATAQLAVLTVAAALSAALVGSGPLALVICKRRYRDEQGVAKDNTVLGVLVAAFVVLTGTLGLVATGAAVVDRSAALIAAVVAAAVLLVYAIKSIPQTLAQGSVQAPTSPKAPEERDDDAGEPRPPGTGTPPPSMVPRRSSPSASI